jgi:beta-phosphoglucomutase
MAIKAVIFDLDGVIVSTDKYHYQGWQQLADEEHIYFDDTINHRLRGVSRAESLAILLERSTRQYTEQEKRGLAERKNVYYRKLLEKLTPADILPGAAEVLAELRACGIKTAVASSSKNAATILGRIGMSDAFDAHVDGNDISNSKPHPEVFLKAAERLGAAPADCLVVEDAEAGVDAGLAGGMKVLAVGYAATCGRATRGARDLSAITVGEMLMI